MGLNRVSVLLFFYLFLMRVHKNLRRCGHYTLCTATFIYQHAHFNVLNIAVVPSGCVDSSHCSGEVSQSCSLLNDVGPSSPFMFHRVVQLSSCSDNLVRVVWQSHFSLCINMALIFPVSLPSLSLSVAMSRVLHICTLFSPQWTFFIL